MSDAAQRTDSGGWSRWKQLRWRSIFVVAVHLLIFIGAVALYTATLNGDVQPADSGEFQIAAISLGIPHPPGYPLFTLLGWLFAQVPLGSPFARVSFLSVVASALTLVLVSATVWQVGEERVKGRRGEGEDKRDKDGLTSSLSSSSSLFSLSASLPRLLAGIAAAVALGTSTTFWAQATTTNIRSLTALFTALMLFVSARAWTTRKPSTLVWFALAFGFGVGHHVSLVFVGVVLGAFALMAVWRTNRSAITRWLVWAAVALAATQLVWLYLPLRDAVGARFAPGSLNTLDGLLFHIFARGFAGDMLAFAAPEFLFDRMALLPTLFNFQFGLVLLVLMALGTVALLVRNRVLGLVWLLAFVVHLFITITYRAPQTVEYALPCWVIACVLMGSGLASVVRVPRWPRAVLAGVGVVALVAIAAAAADGAMRWPSYLALARDRTTRERAESVLRYAQNSGAILAQWHQATPMWALQDVEGLKRDVTVEYVYPRGSQPYAQSFAERAKALADVQLTYVTSFFPSEFAQVGLQTFPLSNTLAWRVAPSFNFPTGVYPSHTFDGRVVVTGPLGLDDKAVQTGDALSVDLWWYRRQAPKDGDSITVRIMRPDGRLAANADVRLAPDETISSYYFKRVAVGVPLDLPPGRYDVLVGAYRAGDSGIEQFTSDAGQSFERAATITVEARSTPPVSQHPIDAGNTNSAPQLMGVDYDTGIAGQVRVWTHWQLGPKPQEITLIGADNQPLAPSKTLPAAASPSSARYLSLPFDILPTRDVRTGYNNQRLPPFADGERYVPFANQMVLVGASVQRNGASLKADIQWLAARPIVDDFIVSARIEGKGFYQTHDSVPALGAVPTLKWIRGSRVLDRHPFDLGDYRDALRGTVVVYDSVSQLPLPPLDERYENGVNIMGN